MASEQEKKETHLVTFCFTQDKGGNCYEGDVILAGALEDKKFGEKNAYQNMPSGRIVLSFQTGQHAK